MYQTFLSLNYTWSSGNPLKYPPLSSDYMGNNNTNYFVRCLKFRLSFGVYVRQTGFSLCLEEYRVAWTRAQVSAINSNMDHPTTQLQIYAFVEYIQIIAVKDSPHITIFL